jgi:hypothetical protein
MAKRIKYDSVNTTKHCDTCLFELDRELRIENQIGEENQSSKHVENAGVTSIFCI